MGRRILMYFTVFGIAMWFFGNLYEAIVIGPNIAGDSKEQLRAFQQFTEVTNPMYYYVPLTLIAAITLLVWFFRTAWKAPEKLSLEKPPRRYIPRPAMEPAQPRSLGAGGPPH